MAAFYWSATLALLADQISKYLVVHWMELSRVRSIDVFPPLLNLRYGENRGINFGLLDSDADLSRWLLIAFSLAISVFILWWVRRWHRTLPMLICGGLLVGGALGNVLDRVVYGYVLDFLNMSCCGISNPFVFNLADIFIFAGAIGLVVFDSGKRRKNAP